MYCSRTLESLYKNATHPENVYVGICVQNADGDEDCYLSNASLKPYEKNIATIRMKNYEAKGPTWARYLCTTLFNDQDYFLQIDSHTLFEKGWDATAIQMMNEIKENTGSKDVVISHYPPAWNPNEELRANRNLNMVDTICQSFFNERGMVSFLGANSVDMTVNKYVQTPHIAAGMFLCEGKCIREVPYDPNLPNLFVGEEILHSARVWTSGYDIYSPTQVILYHFYTRKEMPHIWDDKKTYNDKDAFNKAKTILELNENLRANPVPENLMENVDKYGLGNKRTLKQFFDFAGIDPVNKKVYKNFCPKPHIITPKPCDKCTPAPGDTSTGAPQGASLETTGAPVTPKKTEGFSDYNSMAEESMSSYLYRNILMFFAILVFFILVLIIAKKLNIIQKWPMFLKFLWSTKPLKK
jgi:hypothetical protein